MANVSTIARYFGQPRGGFIRPAEMCEAEYFDGIELNPETVSAQTIGTVVDYLSRMEQGSSSREAFSISLMGAEIAGRTAEAESFLAKIKGMDDESLQNACKLIWFDQFSRSANAGFGDPSEINADHRTCENIRTMVARTQKFFENFGPVMATGPTFEGGYTDIVTSGDGDFVTEDTYWDLKVLSKKPTNKDTLQTAMYFLMGLHSVHPELRALRKFGIFNPRLNTAYFIDMGEIPPQVIRAIETEVIGYE